MSFVALLMIIVAGALHAGWNALTKRSSDQLAFVWGLTGAIVLLCAPLAIVAIWIDGVDAIGLRYMVASGLIHIGYFALLAAAYRTSELGLAYPVSRGMGVLLIPIASALLLDEAPRTAAWIGIVLIAAGVIWLHIGAFQAAYHKRGWQGVISWFALANGVVIATYSLVDARGVQTLHPVIYNYGQMAIAFVGLSAWFLLTRSIARLRPILASPRMAAIAGLGSYVTYTLVLAATRLAPVAYVGPMREVSIVFGVFIGARFLGERMTSGRIIGVALVVLGIVAIKILG
ncbi:MAG: EamA family transporter [Thermomicrobiales bacterium]|nr:EamA family transporter [Thermomicrobiales bacterium]